MTMAMTMALTMTLSMSVARGIARGCPVCMTMPGRGRICRNSGPVRLALLALLNHRKIQFLAGLQRIAQVPDKDKLIVVFVGQRAARPDNLLDARADLLAVLCVASGVVALHQLQGPAGLRLGLHPNDPLWNLHAYGGCRRPLAAMGHAQGCPVAGCNGSLGLKKSNVGMRQGREQNTCHCGGQA